MKLGHILTTATLITIVITTVFLLIPSTDTTKEDTPPSTEEKRLNKNIEKINIEEDGIVCYKYSDRISDKGGLSCLPEDEVLQ